MGHWKDESQAVGFFQNLGVINPNLVDLHAVFFLLGRRGWQRKFLPIAGKSANDRGIIEQMLCEMACATRRSQL
jgi:hypothetical protein